MGNLWFLILASSLGPTRSKQNGSWPRDLPFIFIYLFINYLFIYLYMGKTSGLKVNTKITLITFLRY